jgi:peptidoglycan/LPS O-acetylase OafA/YrhL
MSTPSSKHLPYLDGWRGLAILFLLLGHFFPVRGINLGHAGVNLFFVLSGFLMARLLFLDAVPVPTFYKRRSSRIFPAVFCFLALIVCSYLVLGKPVNWTATVAAAAFVNNYFPSQPGAPLMPFGHIWSLCVEEHSYVLLSIVAVAARAGVIRATVAVGLLAALFAAIGIGYWLTYEGQYLNEARWIHSEVSAYGIFVSAFLLLAIGSRKMPRVPLAVVPGLVALGFALHWWSVPPPVGTIFGVGAFALAVNLLEGAPRLIHQALAFPPLRRLGLWSFSIYLWQQPFYLYVMREQMSPWVGVALAVGAGICSFYLLENPARLYLNRKWAAKRDAGSRQEIQPGAPVAPT